MYYAEEWTNEAAMRERVRSHGFTLVLAILEAVQQPHVREIGRRGVEESLNALSQPPRRPFGEWLVRTVGLRVANV